KNSVKNARSTIGTATEISDYLRLLYAKAGKTICPKCDLEVREDSPQSVMELLLEKHAGERAYVVAPIAHRDAVSNEAMAAELVRAGFNRIFTGDGARPFVELDAADADQVDMA